MGGLWCCAGLRAGVKPFGTLTVQTLLCETSWHSDCSALFCETVATFSYHLRPGMIARTPAGDNDTKNVVVVSSSAGHDDANSGKGWLGDVRERGERGARDKRGERGEESEDSNRVSASTLSSKLNLLIETRLRIQSAYRNAVANSICLSKRGWELNLRIETRCGGSGGGCCQREREEKEARETREEREDRRARGATAFR